MVDPDHVCYIWLDGDAANMRNDWRNKLGDGSKGYSSCMCLDVQRSLTENRRGSGFQTCLIIVGGLQSGKPCLTFAWIKNNLDALSGANKP